LRRSVDRYLWVGPTDPSLVAVETVAEQAVRAVVHPAAAQTAIDTVPWTATVIWRLSDQKSAPRFLPTCLRDGEPDFEPKLQCAEVDRWGYPTYAKPCAANGPCPKVAVESPVQPSLPWKG